MTQMTQREGIAQGYFNQKLGSIGSASAADLRDQVNIINGCLYIAKKISPGSGTEKLLQSTTVRKVGVSNFDDNRLGATRNFSADQIAVVYDVSQATAGKEALVPYTSATIPAGVLNADLHISIDGKRVASFPMNTLKTKETNHEAGKQFIQLGEPIFFPEQKIISIEIEYPEGATAHATNAEYLKVLFNGFESVIS